MSTQPLNSFLSRGRIESLFLGLIMYMMVLWNIIWKISSTRECMLLLSSEKVFHMGGWALKWPKICVVEIDKTDWWMNRFYYSFGVQIWHRRLKIQHFHVTHIKVGRDSKCWKTFLMNVAIESARYDSDRNLRKICM